jgi:hypothetical protein
MLLIICTAVCKIISTATVWEFLVLIVLQLTSHWGHSYHLQQEKTATIHQDLLYLIKWRHTEGLEQFLHNASQHHTHIMVKYVHKTPTNVNQNSIQDPQNVFFSSFHLSNSICWTFPSIFSQDELMLLLDQYFCTLCGVVQILSFVGHFTLFSHEMTVVQQNYLIYLNQPLLETRKWPHIKKSQTAIMSKQISDNLTTQMGSSPTYTGCFRKNLPYFGRTFLRLIYIDITKHTNIQSWTIMEMMQEKCLLVVIPSVSILYDALSAHCASLSFSR